MISCLIFRSAAGIEISSKNHLVLAKYYIINGNIEKARHLLEGITKLPDNLEDVRKWYLSLIAFIDGDYNKSLVLGQTGITQYRHQCLMNIINLISLNKTMKEIKKELHLCKLRTAPFTHNNHFWIDNIVKIREKIIKIDADESDEKKTILDYETTHRMLINADSNEKVKLILKLALFANQEDQILKDLHIFSEESFSSHNIRELIGFLYLHMEDKQKVMEFIEDIDSANAENIKGNIELSAKKHELALGHYNLALKKKSNSQNALERAIPLTIALEKWDMGKNLTKRLNHTGVDKQQILALNAMFNTHLENYKKAWEQLERLNITFGDQIPNKILQIKIFLASVLDYHDKLDQYSDEACKKFSGIDCWIQLQTMVWKNFSKHLKSTQTTIHKQSYFKKNLKKKSTISPIDEEIFIDQKEIGELDDTDAVKLLLKLEI